MNTSTATSPYVIFLIDLLFRYLLNRYINARTIIVHSTIGIIGKTIIPIIDRIKFHIGNPSEVTYAIIPNTKNTYKITFSTTKQLVNLDATNVSGLTGSDSILSMSSLKYSSLSITLKLNTNENADII